MSDLRFRNCQKPSSSKSTNSSCIQNRSRESILAVAIVGSTEEQEEEGDSASGEATGEESVRSKVEAGPAAATAIASPGVNRLIYISFEKYK